MDFDFLDGGWADCRCHWRLYLCLLPVLLLACALVYTFPDAYWPWFIIGPLALVAHLAATHWQRREEK
jgi:hypothetical protein